MLYGHSGAVWGSCGWWIDQNATYGILEPYGDHVAGG